MNQKLKHFLKLILLFLVCFGSYHCSVHDPIETPQLDSIPKTFKDSSNISSVYEDFGKWWEQFKMPLLDHFMKIVIEKNYDAQASLAQIHQKQALLGTASALYFPEVSVEHSSLRTSSIPPTTKKEIYTDQFSLNLKSSYELDLFGTKKHQFSATQLELFIAFENHKITLNKIAKEFALTWFSFVEQTNLLQLAIRTLKAEQDYVLFIEESIQKGLLQVSHLILAQQQVIAIEMDILESKKKIKLLQYNISKMMGKYPKNLEIPEVSFFKNKLQPIKAGLPLELMQRRSDIKIALANLKIADHQVGIAIGNRFPKISLTGQVGRQSAKFSELTNPNNAFWNLIGNITLPIFDAGKRKSEVKRQKANVKQKIAAYKNTLLASFQEVEQLILEISFQKKSLELLYKKQSMLKDNFQFIEDDFQNGLIQWSEVTNARRELYNIQVLILSSLRKYYELKTSLYVALGNTWTKDYIYFEE